MTDQQQSFESLINKVLDTFFHLPTLIALALVAIIILWRMGDAGLYLGSDFVRLYTNQGNLTLDWIDGCCDLDW